MTDRMKGCTVTFDRDIRDDDVEVIYTAIRMIKGVANVRGLLTDITDYMARERISSEVRRKLYQAIDDAFEDRKERR